MRLIALIALLSLSAPAVAQETSGARPPAEKKICRAIPTTGSIMPKRECHTKAEWDAISQQSTAAREKLDRDYGGRTGGIGVTAKSN